MRAIKHLHCHRTCAREAYCIKQFEVSDALLVRINCGLLLPGLCPPPRIAHNVPSPEIVLLLSSVAYFQRWTINIESHPLLFSKTIINTSLAKFRSVL